MDIQSLKEFEAWWSENYDRDDFEDVVFSEILNEYESNYIVTDDLNKAWSAWQAAKAQVDQKVKLLLCDEHLKKCESPTGIFNSQYPDEEPCLICLAKEAKAQAVPEGFVLVPKEPTLLMQRAGSAEAIKPNLGIASMRDIYKAMIEAQEPAND